MDSSQPPPHLGIGAQPIDLFCPHCQAQFQLSPQQAGEVVSCPNCNGRFQAPLPQATIGRASGGHNKDTELNPGIKICVLISAIANVLFGLIYISTVCGAVIGIPQIVLGVFEFIYFAQADNKPLEDSLKQGKLLGIFEIVSGLFNGVGVVCGILVLVFASNQKS